MDKNEKIWYMGVNTARGHAHKNIKYITRNVRTMIWTLSYEIWERIIIALGSGFIFLFLSNYFLKRKEISAKYERYKKAKETVIDVLESSLINKQSISPERIKHLISAAEREQNVELIDSPKSLVEELELRVEKSKHLDTEQQWHYINQIEEMIAKIERESIISSVPLSYEEILISLKENIEAEKKDDALKGLEKLSTNLSERRPNYGSSGMISTVATLIGIIVAIITISVFLSGIFNLNHVDTPGQHTSTPTATPTTIPTTTPTATPTATHTPTTPLLPGKRDVDHPEPTPPTPTPTPPHNIR